MSVLTSRIHRGLLNLPGASAASKAAVESLLKADHETHHCYFNSLGFHNHLSHHILAAYDLGAPIPVLKAIYEDESKMQRPIDLNENGVTPEGAPKPGTIKEENWKNWLGDEKAFSAYLAFFSIQVSKLGIAKALEEYIFSPAANGNNSNMLLRLVGGILHPFIQIGYGLEFSCELQVAAGIAQAAVHDSQASSFIPLDKFTNAGASVNGIHSTPKGRQPHSGPSILSLLQQIYDSPKLTPVLPYEPDAFLLRRFKDFASGGRLSELHRIMAQFDPGNTDEALEALVEELIFVSTLLAFGTGKPHRKPRVDFFLMHLLTSSLFLPSFFKHLPNVEHRSALLRTYLQPWGTVLMVCGRPRIDPALLMSYTDSPVPPDAPAPRPQPSSLAGDQANHWLAIIADVIHAPDSHTVKALRALLYGATKYGTLPKGDVIGAFDAGGKETHPGIAEVDGTVFIRAAGVLMDALKWVTHGQKAGDWDRSGLGWEDAWKGDD